MCSNWLLGVGSHGLLNPVTEVGDEDVEARLPAGATLLPPVRRDPDGNAIIQQRTTRVSL